MTIYYAMIASGRDSVRNVPFYRDPLVRYQFSSHDLADLADGVSKRMKLPEIVSKIACWVDKTIQGLGFYHQKFHVLSEMNKTITSSIGKARRELGYQPTVALEEGMRRSLQWVVDKQGGL